METGNCLRVSTVALTNYHKLGSLEKQQTYLIALEVRGPTWVSLGSTKVSTGSIPFWHPRGEPTSGHFPVSKGFLHSLAYGSLRPSSKPVTLHLSDQAPSDLSDNCLQDHTWASFSPLWNHGISLGSSKWFRITPLLGYICWVPLCDVKRITSFRD